MDGVLRKIAKGWAVGYDKDSQEMTIVFPNGMEYSYSGVPPDLVEGMAKADSPGTYFNALIRGQY